MLTNLNRTVLYTGVTNDLNRRLIEHWIGHPGAFTTRYKVYYLLWASETQYVLNAIDLEKRIKRLTRHQKQMMIAETNPEWTFLNDTLHPGWPPTPAEVDAVKAYWRDAASVSQHDALFFLNQVQSPDDWNQ